MEDGKSKNPTLYDYLRQFHSVYETGILTDKAVVLYWQMLNMFNTFGWKKWVGVDTAQLMAMLHTTNKKTALRERDVLIRAGLIEYKKGHRGKVSEYRLGYSYDTQSDTYLDTKTELGYSNDTYSDTYLDTQSDTYLDTPHKNKDLRLKSNIPPTPPNPDTERAAAAGYDPAYGEVMTALLNYIPQASEIARGEMTAFYETLGRDLCLRAIYTAMDERKSGFSYIRGILHRCQQEGIRTLADWDRAAQEKEARKEAIRKQSEPRKELPSDGFKIL